MNISTFIIVVEVMFNRRTFSLVLATVINIQLLTNEALEASVNMGILWAIAHHIQCLISQ